MDHEHAQARFLEVYDTHAGAIYRFCVLKVSTAEVAEDITQETFMRFWQALRSGKTIENERAYLYTLARNLVIDWYRKKKDSSLDALSDAGFEFAGEDHRRIVESAETREVLAIIAKLDDASREVLLLRFVEGLSPKDIAELNGESANAVSVRINRAIKKVQELIHER